MARCGRVGLGGFQRSGPGREALCRRARAPRRSR